jgi:sortase A
VPDVEPPAPDRTRTRKFDRPAPPHDWRWWIGGIGKTLIATGLLMFAFVAYQLWGTGIETARAQNSLETEFEELLAGTPPTTAAPVDTTPVDTTPPTETDPADAVTPETPPVGSTPTNSIPPTTAAAPAPVASRPPVAEGDPIARLELPTIGVDKIVVAGVEKNDLKKGPGHYPDTPLPGQLGNSAIAGHRTTFGQPFFDVDKLRNGDEIVVTTLDGRFVYRVTGQEIVSPSDYQVIATTDPTRATLTLTSCHPKYTARERIIVYAELDPAATTGSVGAPTINYGRPLDVAAAADPDPTNTVVDPATTDDRHDRHDRHRSGRHHSDGRPDAPNRSRTSTRRRAPKPLMPRGFQPPGLATAATPAMSMWAQRVPWAKWARNSAALEAPAFASPRFFRSATSESSSAR